MHEDEYRARDEGLQPGLTVEDLRRRVRELKAHKGFDITLEQGLAYPTSEVGEAAEEVLRLSRNGHAAVVGAMDAGGVNAARERLGEEICDVGWNLLDLADLAGVDLGGRLREEGRTERGQRMVARR